MNRVVARAPRGALRGAAGTFASVLAVAALAVSAPAAAPQAPPQPAPVEEKVEVALHLLEVAVSDAAGRPVAGLGADNFVVTVDGERRDVVSVDAASAHAPAAPVAAAPSTAQAPAAAAEPAPAQTRWVTLVFDSDHLEAASRETAVRTARRFVETGLAAQDQVAVVLIHEGGSRYLHPFTPVKRFDVGVLSTETLFPTFLPTLADQVRDMVARVAECSSAAEPSSCIYNGAAEFLQFARVGNRRSLDALATVVGSMASLPGRKALLLFGDGYVLSPGALVVTAAERFMRVGGTVYSRLQDAPDWSFEALLAAAARSQVSVFPLRTGRTLDASIIGADSNRDINGAQAGGRDPLQATTAVVVADLQRAAEQTGGRVYNLNGGPPDTTTLLAHLDSIYTLGIRAVAGDSVRSRVKVKLSGVKGKLVAPDRLLRRETKPRALTGALVADDAGVHVELDAERFRSEAAGGAEPVSRVSLYWRASDDKGRTLADDFALVEYPRGAQAAPRFRFDLPAGVTAGARLVEVHVTDVLGGGQVTLLRTLERP